MMEIREIDSDEFEVDLISLLKEHLTDRSDPKRFQWFYRDNPHGPARVWAAMDQQDGIVGSAAIIPRIAVSDGKSFNGCVMADFWVHPRHRVLGPALRLQRACIDGARESGMQFFLDLPQGNMPAIYRRLRIEARDQLIRYSRPLRSEKYLDRVSLPKFFSARVKGVANFLLSAPWRFARHRENCAIGVEPCEFGTEFDELARRALDPSVLSIERTSAYLRWRYQRHYYLRHHLVSVRVNGKLMAYAIFVVEEGIAQIVDISGEPSEEFFRDLLLGTCSAAHELGADAVSCPLMSTDRRISKLVRLWFRPRQRSIVIFQALAGQAEQILQKYRFAYGDLDY